MPDDTEPSAPVPADETGADLAVVRPILPSDDLAAILDGAVAPLSAIFGLDDQRFRAFAIEVARLSRVSAAGRLVVGAYLHKRRAEVGQGEWTPFVSELADVLQVSTRTLGDWKVAAERHFGMELTKGANPGRRAPRPGPELAKPASSGRKGAAPAPAPRPTPPPEPAPPASPDPPSASLAGPRRVVCPRCDGAGTLLAPQRNPVPDGGCPPHPKEGRKKLGYMTTCGACGAVMKPGE